jgi:conjugal transfer pilus assembly protein TraW
MNKLLPLLILYSNVLSAKDLGAQGPIYDIKEQDALEWIEQRLNQMDKSGEIQRHQEKLKKQALFSIRNPKAVKNISKATVSRQYEQDLSFVLSYDIKTPEGKIIHRAGDIINPLRLNNIAVENNKALIFIDGEDVSQLTWALKQQKKRASNNMLSKLVLTNGSATDLMEHHQIRFYFDQAGKLVNHFKIKHVPAIVEQKGDKLIISEVKI